MAFDWNRMTDDQKQFKLDSLRPELQKAIDVQPAQMVPTAEGPRRIRMQFDFRARAVPERVRSGRLRHRRRWRLLAAREWQGWVH